MKRLDYATPVVTLAGAQTDLGDHQGKVLLVVNTASACSYTPQYRALEELHQRFESRGFAVLGFPCNQFGEQEPGTSEEIAAFCRDTYNVSFPLYTRVEVNGPGAHPLFVFLTRAAPGLLGSRRIKWNFTKFLIDRDGQVVTRFGPPRKPETIAARIDALLGPEA